MSRLLLPAVLASLFLLAAPGCTKIETGQVYNFYSKASGLHLDVRFDPGLMTVTHLGFTLEATESGTDSEGRTLYTTMLTQQASVKHWEYAVEDDRKAFVETTMNAVSGTVVSGTVREYEFYEDYREDTD